MDGSGPKQTAAYLAAALLLLIGGAYLLGGGRSSEPAAPGGGVALDGAGGAAASGRAGAPRPAADEDRPIFVHVAGAVRRPGIYRVRSGSRAAEAVRKAGGLTRRADLTAVNLAEAVKDAQQVIVPRRGEAQAAAAATGGAAGGAGVPGALPQPLSLSRATPDQLEELEGIGPKLAQAIIGYRDRHKGFKSIEELREVDGIGEKRFATLSKAVKP